MADGTILKGQALCHACNAVVRPVRTLVDGGVGDGGASLRFRDACPICQAPIAISEAHPSTAPTAESTPALPKPADAVATVQQAAASSFDLTSCKATLLARLETIDAALALTRQLKTERASLARLLGAMEPKRGTKR